MLGAFAMDTFDAELIHFSSIASGLAKLGYNASVYHLSPQDKPAITSLLSPEINFHEQFVPGRSNNTLFIKGIISTPRFLFYLIKNKPHVLYARIGIVSGVYIIATRIIFRNKVKIITEHNGWIGPEAITSGKLSILAWIGKLIQKFSARCSDCVRAVSDGVKDYLISLGTRAERIAVIGNGTDTKHFKPLDIKPAYDIGFVGNLAKWQGVDSIILAVDKVIRLKPEIRFAIGGSGPEEQTIKKMVQQYNLGDQVSFVGSIPYKNVPQFINNCKICLAPFKPRGSSIDNNSLSPLKIRDYAACGKPIISSKIPGLEEIDEAGFGILISPGDINTLTSSIIKLLDDSSLADSMGNTARKYAEKHYSWFQVSQKIAIEIEKLLDL